MTRKPAWTHAELIAELHHATAETVGTPAEVDELYRHLVPELISAFNAHATARGRHLVRTAFQDAAVTWVRNRAQRADLSPWCGPDCRPFANPPEHSSADHSARSGERAGSRRDV